MHENTVDQRRPTLVGQNNWSICTGIFNCYCSTELESIQSNLCQTILIIIINQCGLCCRPVSFRPSVCPSNTFVYCTQLAEYIVTHLFRLNSPTSLVFWLRAPIPNSKRNPFSGGKKRTGWKILRFSTEIPVYLGNGTRSHDCYGTLIGNHRWRIDSCRFRWPPVTLKGRTHWLMMTMKIFRRISVITLVPFGVERPNTTG